MRRISTAPLLVLAGAWACLATLAPPASLVATLRDAVDPSADPVALATALAGVACWVVAAWLTTSVALVVAARAPGAVGRAAGSAAARISPAIVRRLLGGGVAATLVLAPALAPALASAGTVSSCGAAALPSLDRTPCGTAPIPVTTTGPTTAPAPTSSLPSPPASSGPAPSAPAGSATSGRTPVLVRPGDTLWDLAAAELTSAHLAATPPAVAARWPAWWQANRAVIGADPDLIHPGTSLVPPPPAPEEPR